jgi:hypothetical protein
MNTAIPNDPAPTLEDIWRLFRETDLKFQETDKKMQETDRQLKENAQQQKETDRQIKAMSKKIGELGNRLGEFVEAFVEPSIVRLFQERGVDITAVMRDVKAKNPKLNLAMEIDLFAINGDSCVLVEVKSNLSIDDVNEHLERMDKFKTLFPIYKDYKVLGAITGMVIPENVARYAYKKGFFVIAQKGDSAVILNDNKFQPTTW